MAFFQLQFALLSIALLGSVLCIASGTSDFNLITEPPKGTPKFDWKYVKYPDSFKICLMQMVDGGYIALKMPI
ncbi:hypothetical protein BJV78DRAFT_1285328 [Lactifluus subvellereus]|nr:hypothetical protein BJV78DRAFT_1285328 [Lactifluus subvellereus]